MFKFIKNVRQKIFNFRLKSVPIPSDSLYEAGTGQSLGGDTEDKTGSLPKIEDKKPDRADGRKKPPRRRKKAKKAPITMEDWNPSEFNIPIEDGKTRFHDFELNQEIMRAVFELGFIYCTPIQAKILPILLSGRDAMGQAQTGTGKTAAFLISTLKILSHNTANTERANGAPRVLIIAPTRELAIQIGKEAGLLAKYMDIKIAILYGGMDYQRQKREVSDNPVDIIVATPGRLLDFHQHQDLFLGKVEILIIDEADRMLDMGFIPQVRQIVRATPHKDKRQTLLFSATITPEVERLAASWTYDPAIIQIEPEKVEADSVDQIIYLITKNEKLALLYNLIMRQNLHRVIVFCNRRDETRRLEDFLKRYCIQCECLSGEIPQKKRLRTLDNFRAGNIRVLVATDVAGRGLHIEGVTHVINYTLPSDPENYVHRIGRTGRAGAAGVSISFACEEDSFQIPDIEQFIGHELRCTQPDDDWIVLPEAPEPKTSPASKSHRNQPRARRKRSKSPI